MPCSYHRSAHHTYCLQTLYILLSVLESVYWFLALKHALCSAHQSKSLLDRPPSWTSIYPSMLCRRADCKKYPNARTSGEARGSEAGSRLRRLREWENLSDQGNVKIVASRLALYSCWGQKDSLLTRSRQKDSPIKMQACLSPRWLCQERQTDRARETETDRGTDRDRQRDRQRETDRQTDRERERERDPPRHDVIRYAWKTHATGATVQVI